MPHSGELSFDDNATRRLLPAVQNAIVEAANSRLLNPSSPHDGGRRARRLLREARANVADFIHTTADRILFTSGGSEANHLALVALRLRRHRPRHLVTSSIEHPSLLAAAEHLEVQGTTVTRVDPDQQGRVSVQSVLQAVREDTDAVALMSANNETGVLQPVAEVAAELPDSVHFHVDAVQSAAHGSLPPDQFGADTVTLSGHKLGAPAGCGALFVRKGVQLRPWIGGGTQERGIRPGTENLLGIHGLGAAAAWWSRHDLPGPELRDLWEQLLEAELPDLAVFGRGHDRLANTSLITFPGIDGTRLVESLSRRDMYVSQGAACQAGSPEPSHVLRASGLGLTEIRSTLRFSLDPDLTKADLLRAASLVVQEVRILMGAEQPGARKEKA